jgi:hypothetical protein
MTHCSYPGGFAYKLGRYSWWGQAIVGHCCFFQMHGWLHEGLRRLDSERWHGFGTIYALRKRQMPSKR